MEKYKDMLTGKAKEQFEQWYGSNYIIGVHDVYHLWNILPLSMQWGVYLEWADSIGYIITLYENDGGGKWGVYISTSDNVSASFGYKQESRKEAQTEALKKLNELINE